MSSTTNLSGLGLSTAQDAAISFENGISTTGTLNSTNFLNWNGDTPATYGSHGHATGTVFKAGSSTIGTGGTISYYFDPGSNWTGSEQAAIKAAMQLWSDESGVQFVAATSAATADETFYRYGSTTANNPAVADEAFTSSNSTLGTVGTTTAGHEGAGGYTAIDTAAFGDVNSYTELAGYGITTIVHELGHAIGLGHSGPYDGAVDSATQQNGAYDNRAYSIMSYIDPSDTSAEYYSQYAVHPAWGSSAGYLRTPLTPMMDDVLAAQQVYGAPTSGGLMGGQVFGFNCNITDGTQEFFDFTLDTEPVVNIYDAGTGNTLDLSGFSTANTVNLNGGTFSSVAGLTDNISISYGTRIDSFVGGSGNDTITLNMDADTIDGGAGTNTVIVAGTQAQYSMVQNTDGSVSISGDGQSATLTHIAMLSFSDGSQEAVPAADLWAGGSGSYSTAGNWTGAVPNATALAIISAGTAVLAGTATGTAGTVLVSAGAGLTLAGHFTLAGTGISDIEGALNVVNGGVLSAGGTITLGGTMTIGAASAGHVVVASGGLEIDGGTITTADRTDNSIAGGALTLNGTTFDGAGTISAALVNNGTISAGLTHALVLAGGAMNAGLLQAGAGGLVISGGTITQQTGASIVADGGAVTLAACTISGGTLAATADAVVSGAVTLCDVAESGLLNLQSGADLVVSGGSLGGTIGFGGSDVIAIDDVAGFAATLSGFGIGDAIQFGGVSGATLSSAGNVVSVIANGASIADLTMMGGSGLQYAMQANGTLVAQAIPMVVSSAATSGGTTTVVVSSGGTVSSGASSTTSAGGSTVVSPGGTVSSPGSVVSSGGTTTATPATTTTPASSGAAVATTTTTTPVVTAGATVTLPTVSTVGTASPGNTSGPSLVLNVGGAETTLGVSVANGALVITGGGGSTSTPIAASGVTQVQFTDGTAILDTTGAASDVARLYQAAFDRQADAGGLSYFAVQLTGQNLGLGAIATGFLSSAEGHTLAAESSAAFVTQIYQNTTGTGPDSGGLAYWVNAIDSGAISRASSMVSIGESGEAQVATQQTDGSNSAAEIDRLYQAIMNRAPDAGGQAYWAGLLQSGASATQVAAGLLSSSEFATDGLTTTQFVDQMYQTALGRAPDASGEAWFVSQIDSGSLTKATAAITFADSAEARANSAASTHQGWVWLKSG